MTHDNESTRREFLHHISLAAFALGAGVRSSGAGPREPHLSFPTSPRERLAVTSWPFREYIISPTNHGRSTRPAAPATGQQSAPERPMDLKEFPGIIAKRFGVHNINPLADHFASTDSAYIDAFRKAVERAGSHMVDLGLSGRKFWDPDLAERQASVDYGKKWIDIATVVGSPSVRQHLAGSHGMKPDVDVAAKTLGALADYGASKNIAVILENDAPVNEDPFLIVKIIEKAGNPYLRALPDVGNSLEGGDADFNERGVTAMFQHAFNMCHVKDAVMGAAGQVYKVDLAKMFGIAKASGYKGYFSMEWEVKFADPFTGTERLIKETLKYLT